MDNKPTQLPRLLTAYRQEIVPKMKEKFGYTNNMAVPRLNKIVVNMGVGEGNVDPKITEAAAKDLSIITGQKAKICRSRKPISNFKLKKGSPVGCCVTLRRYRMYEFLDRMISIAFPRIRDFRGFPNNSFDGQGNYTFGLLEQNIFPELEADKITKTVGMNVTFDTSAQTDAEAKELLTLLGFPFRR